LTETFTKSCPACLADHFEYLKSTVAQS